MKTYRPIDLARMLKIDNSRTAEKTRITLVSSTSTVEESVYDVNKRYFEYREEKEYAI